jgi:hypothetical protein
LQAKASETHMDFVEFKTMYTLYNQQPGRNRHVGLKVYELVV